MLNRQKDIKCTCNGTGLIVVGGKEVLCPCKGKKSKPSTKKR